MSAEPTLLGTVQDVRGATLSVALTADSISGLTFIEGQGYRLGQIGSFVRLPIGYLDLFGVVSQVGAGAVPAKLADEQPFGYRWITVQLVGEAQAGREFQRGVSQYPTIGDAVHLVTDPDLARIYGRRDAPNCIRLGHLASAESIPALIDANKLITRHSAVVGATGSGKSTTVVSILKKLSSSTQFPSSRIIVFDIHGEYAKPLRTIAEVFSVNPNANTGEKALLLPYWALTSDELLPLTFGQLDDTARSGVLERLLALKQQSLDAQKRAGVSKDAVSADSPVPFSIHQLWLDLYRLVYATHTKPPGPTQDETSEAFAVGGDGAVIDCGEALAVRPPRYKAQSQAAGEDKIFLSGSTLNIRRQVDTLGSRLRDPRLGFFFSPGPWLARPKGQPQLDLDTLIAGWIGGPKPVTVLDLSGVPASILTHIIGVLLRVLFDAMFWARNRSEAARERPVLLVLEEAHAYLQGGDTGLAATTVRRLAKEGRKYGLGLMVISQRPAEVDSTVLSQCGSIVALRLSNGTDRKHVASAISDNLESLTTMLPVLRTGEAIVFGECVHLPVRLLADPPPEADRPDSSDPLVYDDLGPGGWNRGREPGDYGAIVQHWRQQSARVERPKPMERTAVVSLLSLLSAMTQKIRPWSLNIQTDTFISISMFQKRRIRRCSPRRQWVNLSTLR